MFFPMFSSCDINILYEDEDQKLVNNYSIKIFPDSLGLWSQRNLSIDII